MDCLEVNFRTAHVLSSWYQTVKGNFFVQNCLWGLSTCGQIRMQVYYPGIYFFSRVLSQGIWTKIVKRLITIDGITGRCDCSRFPNTHMKKSVAAIGAVQNTECTDAERWFWTGICECLMNGETAWKWMSGEPWCCPPITHDEWRGNFF